MRRTANFCRGDSRVERQFSFKVTNLANEDPVPMGLGLADSSSVEPGIDGSIYDFAGRVFRLGVRVDFGG